MHNKVTKVFMKFMIMLVSQGFCAFDHTKTRLVSHGFCDPYICLLMFSQTLQWLHNIEDASARDT